jgi:hypothetical protein
VTAAEARVDTDLRARIRATSGTSDRTIVDLLDGYEAQSTAAARARRALEAEGVDLATIPKRSSAEMQEWKRRRQPRLANAMPEGYTPEKCECGREYPRMESEAEGLCPKCWRKHAEALEREIETMRAELEAALPRSVETPAPILRAG